MLNKLMEKRSNRKGFTLIELIIVIAIIAILAAIIIPRFASFQTTAKQKADIADAKTLATTTATLIANGDITITAANQDCRIESGAAAPASTIVSNLQSIPTVRSDGTNTTFWVRILATSGAVEVYSGTGGGSGAIDLGTKFYPQ